ncbi:class A beta-lactamase-related serine hydrolase [Streptomyces armeniacus]|uniref:Class A beta-lactamase-related serine hydrolase n=1 Tax=Streptomyces armeniacus TaxID=83291 RepID=A0A345XU40_9ACTN|nr:serine hydrolase domain-containing protein [Streptomyces armeniacus]AXK35156.1 class A beta-lactamase-related serine hydrolase [Streptomyces armeniacus]
MTRLLPARRAAVVLTAVGALAATALPALAGPPDARQAPGTSEAPDRPRRPHAATQAALDAIVADGTPGVIAQARDHRGSWHGRAGSRDLAGGHPRGTDEKFRVASITKPFTATVLLMLEARGELSLDDSVEEWLPGIVRGEGYHPEDITVRHLLNHTSGIFDYNMDEGFRALYAGAEFDRNRYREWRPRELVDIALAHPANFQPREGSRPGEPGRWDYSDTNYVLAGMVVERVTGGTYREAVERLLIRPLGLRGTSVPGTSPRVPRPHATHWSTLFEDGPDAKVYDVTEFSPTVAFSAGQLISTVDDVNTFLSALLGGELLPPAQQRALLAAVDVDGDKGHGGPEDTYGLGIRHFKLGDGCRVWGHGGMIPGSASRTTGTRDGRHVLTVNRNGDWGDQELEDAAVEAEFCAR